ncbi:uncharacterized protein C12orf71 homolog [Ictidomys tridecemlineatus]
MDDSSPVMEHSISESKSNQSLPVGHFPSEAGPDCEAVIPCEDLPSEGPSSLPPVQGACGTSHVRGPMGRRNGIQDKPEKLREKAIMEIMYAYLSCLHGDSVANWAQSDDYQRMDKCQQERMTQSFCELEDIMKNIKEFLDNPDDEDNDPVLSDSPLDKDVQPSSIISSHMDQISPEEQEAGQDLPKCQRAENGDPKQCPGLEKDEIVEMESQEPGTAESSPGSSEQSEEGDLPSDKEGTSCLNFPGFFH